MNARKKKNAPHPTSRELQFARTSKSRPCKTIAGSAITLFCIAFTLSGCAQDTIDINPIQQNAPEHEKYDDRPWANVVRENVAEGLVDYDHLSTHRQPLDEYLSIIAAVGPSSTPDQFESDEAKACYYANAYNACVLAAVLVEGIPETMHTAATTGLEEHYRFTVDRRKVTLAELRALAIASAADMRILFALCDAAIGSPPLQDQPLRPVGLRDTLRTLAKRALDKESIVAIDHENQRLMVCVALANHRAAFLENHRQLIGQPAPTMLNVLLRFAGRVQRQRLNTAVGYQEATIPFDCRLNKQSAGDPDDTKGSNAS